jgi:hypothetical protein
MTMAPTIRRPASDPRLADLLSAGGRAAAILLYVRRLARLLALEPTAGAGLTGREQRRLGGRAVLASVRALTELDAGEVASELLREAGRRRRRAARRRLPRELPPIG